MNDIGEYLEHSRNDNIYYIYILFSVYVGLSQLDTSTRTINNLTFLVATPSTSNHPHSPSKESLNRN